MAIGAGRRTRFGYSNICYEEKKAGLMVLEVRDLEFVCLNCFDLDGLSWYKGR